MKTLNIILVSLFIMMYNMGSHSLCSQSVLGKFIELNELIENTKNSPEFEVDENGFVTITEKNKGKWKFHFSDIDKVEKKVDENDFSLLLNLKDGKKMRYSKRRKNKKRTSDKYLIPFKDEKACEEAVNKFKEAIEVARPSRRRF